MSEENAESFDGPTSPEDSMIEAAECTENDDTVEISEMTDYLDHIADSLLGGAEDVFGEHPVGQPLELVRPVADDNPFLGDRYAELRSGSSGLSEVEDYIEEVELYR